MNIGKFQEYCKENFGLETWGEKVRDKRKRPQIPTIQIFESLVEMPVFGQKTLLALDEFLRTPEARKWHGSDRQQVASDSPRGCIPILAVNFLGLRRDHPTDH